MKTTTTQTINPYTNTPTTIKCIPESTFEQALNPELFEATFFFWKNEREEFKILGRTNHTNILYTNHLGEELEIKLNAFSRIMNVRQIPFYAFHKDYKECNDFDTGITEVSETNLKLKEVIELEDINLDLQEQIKALKDKIIENYKNIKIINEGEKGLIVTDEIWFELKTEIRAFREGKEVIWKSNQSRIENGIEITNWHQVSKEEDFNLFYKFAIAS